MESAQAGIPELIKEFRQALGQTQQQFAQTMGVTITTVARWETRRPPKGKWLAQLALEAERRGWTDIGQHFKRLLSAALFNDSNTAQLASHQQALESPDANPWLEALAYVLESPSDSEAQSLLLDILQTYQSKLARTGLQRDPVHWNRLRKMFRLLDLQTGPTKTEGSIAEPMGGHSANEDPSTKKPEP